MAKKDKITLLSKITMGVISEKISHFGEFAGAASNIAFNYRKLNGFEGFTPDEATDFAKSVTTVFKGFPKPLARRIFEAYNPAKDLSPQDQLEFSYLLENTRDILLAVLPVLQEANPTYLQGQFFGKILRSPGKIRGYAPPFERRKRWEEKLGIEMPWVLALDVTSRCNIQPPCKGCYAGEYQGKDPSFEDLDRIVGEAQDLGISNILVLGGEPLLRKKELLELQKRHKELGYFVFTNATLLDRETIEEFLKTGANTHWLLHIQGDKELTDRDMKPGIFEKALQAMANLREARIPFGFSTSVTQENFSKVTSPEFLEFISAQGAIIGLYFPYVALGYQPDFGQELTAQQRQEFREKASLFVRNGILAVNPEEVIAHKGGCVAAVKYVHVDSKGHLKPCVFIDAHDGTNVYDPGMSLKKALTSDFMRGCQSIQFNPGRTRCLARDGRHELREIVEKTGAYSTEKTR